MKKSQVRKRAEFTKHEMETAIKVFMQSHFVTAWVKSQAEYLGVDLMTPKGQDFYERERRKYAEKLMK